MDDIDKKIEEWELLLSGTQITESNKAIFLAFEKCIDQLKACREAGMGKVCSVELISGVEGPCLAIMGKSRGQRISGPKPWGGGKTIYQFTVSAQEIISAVLENCHDQS